ncbi:XrtB/PEP-CTERM-associated transcriptional regulator EpsA [Nitrosospira sp. Nsp13]|uniref:XrtB/PEP-CTERM-associated transcriptional regulator EpsA n=1 Tax=Nitrosospira sp. Nsp13 TaxID=1855332 RepID=UPI0008831690|nr:XrtB/PEP-CTERM-associated transcriptional regulator EpsA [Nitrosospira sp. Nsp13]SCY59822.1 transcriptional regulator EpsA [Nitrosospira sp. Nsp13]
MIPEKIKFSSFSAEHLQRYAKIIEEGVTVRSHVDLLRWLQGEVQHCLPHEIMLAAWGDFDSNLIQHDVVSALPGVRTDPVNPTRFSPLLGDLYNCWVERDKTPYTLDIGTSGLLLEGWRLQCSLGQALQGMRSSLLHGISDKRGRHDCLYVFFSSKNNLNSSTLSAIEILLPYLDTALRGVAPLPHPILPLTDTLGSDVHGLTGREAEIMEWVKMGKTNAEIGIILSISAFTVKNHMQHIFKKLDVYNRTRAVSKMEAI